MFVLQLLGGMHLRSARSHQQGRRTNLVVVVLGGPKIDDHTPGPDLQARLDRTLALLQKEQVQCIVVTGGAPPTYGSKGTRAEAHVMRDYLARHNVTTTILVEDQAQHTFDNAYFSRRLLAQRRILNVRLLVVTNDWHVARSRLCFEAVFGIETEIDFEAVISDKNDAEVVKRFETENQLISQGWVEATAAAYGLR